MQKQAFRLYETLKNVTRGPLDGPNMASWGHLGAILGPSWASLGHLWDFLGQSWAQEVSKMAPRWPQGGREEPQDDTTRAEEEDKKTQARVR